MEIYKNKKFATLNRKLLHVPDDTHLTKIVIIKSFTFNHIFHQGSCLM